MEYLWQPDAARCSFHDGLGHTGRTTRKQAVRRDADFQIASVAVHNVLLPECSGDLLAQWQPDHLPPYNCHCFARKQSINALQLQLSAVCTVWALHEGVRANRHGLAKLTGAIMHQCLHNSRIQCKFLSGSGVGFIWAPQVDHSLQCAHRREGCRVQIA